ncbi:FHIP family protein AAEL005291-like isoform X1 [Topomyia yanbarensis]|uniref:FHIP family protein AAEL005291-like isoform X1 n=1 Tax=Topomyia yanbarensis TaxID=2498891 RepID=UPI00273C2C90|nr:FHIP family protein AAEL005291-like isoform X1 [Topomyia yanbarensis]XP_058833603.1 FHIP family protein AAEL005291-like isoform X1 [Topomyia yanbarensis]XP_058833605.1 FHIP family protein AAEL005291-like isoform X1 [Topomyia yanbarensis]XP_058833606.1 FHIP family protein AAEL005291-like isoform X1 [Topomyia yanbarensis]XP_058833607.1 FHIP family protein AAEL005291-like isoform X1 [Topomyia yanbarensis]XP_058833608.1 FHIP family protein AAEL005291-like isoform X1 [Topomyia yanbarensis]XP_05
MSWLRSSPLRQSFTKSVGNAGSGSGRSGSSTNGTMRAFDASECDPKACYDSFCIHWQQAYEIIQRSENNRGHPHDDVLGVVTHLEHMATLLLVELHHCNKVSLPGAPVPSAPCLEHLLSENLLDKLYEWGIKTGRYANAVRLEQLKFYEPLVSHSRHQLLVHEPFLRPLLKLLASSQNEIYPPDVAKRLVILLNQLCVVLMQNVHLLDLFFFSNAQQNGTGGHTNFIIFSLLIPYVHRDGSLGHQARDALLLCMALSQKNSNVGTYIATYSSICPVLVTGLGGLYSRLPNQIDIKTIDWYRITTDDVTEMPGLTLFMNSLEFCNAVVQVAHSMIRQQLLDFLYQGFLVPVLGPAILQTFKGRSQLQTNVESQVSAMAYLDLIIRSVTEPGLIQIIVKFLLDTEKFDGQRILDVLVDRLNSTDSRLCMVALSLFDTLLSLNCEDIMLELVLKYLLNCQHVPISHRYKVNRMDPYGQSVEHFLNITPEIMKKVNNVLSINNNNTMTSFGASGQNNGRNISKTIGANWNHYGLNTGETLLASYQAYLLEARSRIGQCKHVCDQWNNVYRYQKLSKQSLNGTSNSQNGNSGSNSLNPTSTSGTTDDVRTYKVQMIKNFLEEFVTGPDSGLETGESDRSNQCQSPTIFGTTGLHPGVTQLTATTKQLDSLQSLGDSSGYESLNITNLCTGSDDGRRNESWKISSVREETIVDLDLSEDLFAQGTVSLGPFLTAIWGKLQTFTSNCLYVNLHLTGLISHLAWFPLPLLHSILLRPDIPTTSDTPSFHQVLKILKQQIDAELPDCDESLEIVDVARSFLVDREFQLINMRKNAIESSTGSKLQLSGGISSIPMTSGMSQTTPMQLTPSSSYDPFKRNDAKRKSISNSFSGFFRRPGSSASSGIAQVFQFFTGGSSSGNATTGHSSSTTINPQQSTGSSTSSSPAVVGGRRDSREAETQFVDHPAMANIAGSLSSPNPGSGHSSLEYSSININGSVIGVGSERQRDLAVSAVILDEWFKELAAITQEQCIVMLSEQVERQRSIRTS